MPLIKATLVNYQPNRSNTTDDVYVAVWGSQVRLDFVNGETGASYRTRMSIGDATTFVEAINDVIASIRQEDVDYKARQQEKAAQRGQGGPAQSPPDPPIPGSAGGAY